MLMCKIDTHQYPKIFLVYKYSESSSLSYFLKIQKY